MCDTNIMEILKGAYDLHVHSAPDILPRHFSDIEVAKRMEKKGFGGFVAKNHFFETGTRCQIVNDVVPGCDSIGAICLNGSIGGINTAAVEMALRSKTKVVWLPTCDSEAERASISLNDGNKLPFFASLINEIAEKGHASEPIKVVDDFGNILRPVLEVIEIIRDYDGILATGHIRQNETLKIIRKAKEMGLKKMIVTHVDFPSTFFNDAQQEELIKCGAFLEHCYNTWATGKVDFSETVRQIQKAGTEHVVIGTDLGGKDAKYPDEGLEMFANKLYESGFSLNEIRRMFVENPYCLLH